MFMENKNAMGMQAANKNAMGERAKVSKQRSEE